MDEGESQNEEPEVTKDTAPFDHLVDLCERGMLYEAEEWLKQGNLATQPAESKGCPLCIASEMGFHSLVKLLLRYESTDEQKLHALELAALPGNLDICKLLVKAGAPVEQLHYEYLDDVIRRPVIETVLAVVIPVAVGGGMRGTVIAEAVFIPGDEAGLLDLAIHCILQQGVDPSGLALDVSRVQELGLDGDGVLVTGIAGEAKSFGVVANEFDCHSILLGL